MTSPLLGQVTFFGGNFAPRGYAFCSGQLLSISSNTALFSILGTTYGGNGQTNFALPDLRGRSPVNFGTGPGLSNIVEGQTGGAETTTLTLGQLPAHTHTATATSTGVLQMAPTRASLQQPDTDGVLARSVDANATDTPRIYAPAGTQTSVSIGGLNVSTSVTVNTAGSSQPVAIRSPFLGIGAIIATQGVFPSRN